MVEFFEDRLSHCLKVPQDFIFDEFLLEEFGLENAEEDFEYLKNVTFTNFFKSSSVDVPRCFRRTKTIRRSINEVEILKLNNYLMRQGKRAKTFKFLSRSINSSFDNYISASEIYDYAVSKNMKMQMAKNKFCKAIAKNTFLSGKYFAKYKNKRGVIRGYRLKEDEETSMLDD